MQELTWIKYGHQPFIFEEEYFLIVFFTFLKELYEVIYTWGNPSIAVAQM